MIATERLAFYMVLLTLCVGVPVAASELEEREDPVQMETARSDSSAGQGTLIPMPVYFYTPETKSGFGAILTLTTRAAGADSTARPTLINAMAIYTVRKQYVFEVSVDGYRRQERHHFNGQISYGEFPTVFYGIGDDTDKDLGEDYTPRFFGAGLSYLFKVGKDLSVGPRASYGYSKIRAVEPGGMLDSGQITGSEGGNLVFLGIRADLDSRDNTFYPRSGRFFEYELNVADGVIGSDFDMTVQRLDLRRYFSVSAKGVLAGRALGMYMTGNPDFQSLAELGGHQLMRGYFQGRFRDRQLYAVQLEYRQEVFWRLGFAVFGSAGDVANEVGVFRIDDIRSTYGLGLRVLLSKLEGIRLRADYGFTDEGGGNFYLGFLEAF